MKVPHRAETDEEKRAIIERLYVLWCQSSQLRLGQLLLNAFHVDFYYVEDEQLIERLEAYYRRQTGLVEIAEDKGRYD